MSFITKIMLLISFLLSIFGIDVPVDTEKPQEYESWQKVIIENYDEFINEVDGDENKIPLILSSDQHGLVKYNSEVFDFINETVDWSKISKIVNLGDTVTLLYNSTDLNEYKYATRNLPTEKRIEITGNHDSHLLLTQPDMSRWFSTYGAVGTDNMNAFTVTDEQFGVTYLTIDPMSYPWTYTNGKITSEQAQFIISALSVKDDNDIVLLAHPYLFNDALIRRDGSVFTGSETFIGDSDVKASFVDMLKARKDKTSGVFTDSEGKTHAYDFSDCTSDFLMTIHGHHHSEGYETKNGITSFLCQGYKENNEDMDEPNCFYFAYIDTETKTFKCWKNVEGYDAWEISIA